MQAFIEFIAGLVVMLAAAVLAQFGLDSEPRRQPDREIHRTDCPEASAIRISGSAEDC